MAQSFSRFRCLRAAPLRAQTVQQAVAHRGIVAAREGRPWARYWKMLARRCPGLFAVMRSQRFFSVPRHHLDLFPALNLRVTSHSHGGAEI